MGMIRRWHSNSLAEKTTEIYICDAYPSSITRNWLVFRYQEIEFRFHPGVESRGWRFVRNQTRPLPASKIRFPYPKAHLRQFASFCICPSPLSLKNPTEKRVPYLQLPTPFLRWPLVIPLLIQARCLTSVKSNASFLIAVKDPKTEACPRWKGRV